MVPVVYPPSVLISTWILMCVSHKRPHSELQVQPCIRAFVDKDPFRWWCFCCWLTNQTPTSLRQARMPAFDINADVPLIPDGPANGSCPAQLLQGPGNGGGDRDTEQMAACSTQSHYVANVILWYKSKYRYEIGIWNSMADPHQYKQNTKLADACWAISLNALAW